MNNVVETYQTEQRYAALSRVRFTATFAVRRARVAPDALGALRRGYDPLDTGLEETRRLLLAHDGPVPDIERRTAARRLAARRALLAQPDGLRAALQIDIPRLEADIVRHRRYLRRDVATFRRAIEAGDATWFARLAISHDKRMLRLLAAKVRDARATWDEIAPATTDER